MARLQSRVAAKPSSGNRTTGQTPVVVDHAADTALERRIGALCDRVVRTGTATCDAFRELVALQTQRYEDVVHSLYTNLVRGLMHGDRPRIQASLFAGCNLLEQLQCDWNTGRMTAQRELLAAADDLRTVTQLLRERLGLEKTIADQKMAVSPVDQLIEDRIDECTTRKRRRVQELREGRERGVGPRADLVDALWDPSAAFGTGLSADEHRLLSTILPAWGYTSENIKLYS
jgi:hypothetical protein